MNPNTRTICIEVLLNEAEESRLDEDRGGLGRSPYFRNLLHAAARTHGMAPPPARESRGCRGVGKPASRATGFMGQRRLF